MRVYLDNCCFNRPFDDQQQIRIKIEAEAKLFIQEKIKNKEIELVWSYILEYENSFNPFKEKRSAIQKWKAIANSDVQETEEIIARAESMVEFGVTPKDALHVSCAIESNCDYFLSTDDKLLKRLASISSIKVMNPLRAAGEIDEYCNRH